LDGQGPFLRETVTGSETSATKLFQVEAGDFVYSRLFAWRGAFGVIGNDLHGCYVSSEFPTFLARREQIDINFLRYWFRLPATLAEVNEDCTGSTPLTRNRFKEQFFLKLRAPLPPMPEQKRIVAQIDACADKIRRAHTLRQEALEEWNAFIVSLHERLSAGRVRRIGQVFRLDEDQVPVDALGSYPQVGIRSFGGGLFHKSAVAGSETTYRTFNRLYDGALVLSQVKGWEGAVAVCDMGFSGWYASPEYRTFRCIDGEALPQYFATLVRSKWFWQRLSAATRGVGARRERTRPEQFLSLELLVPDIDQQACGAAIFSKTAELAQLHAATAAELDALLPAILDRAFKGEL
jgi:type I restriction enzyme S subunit